MPGEHKDEEAIFRAAFKLKSASERTAYLKKACRDDAGLLARVEALLKAHDEAGEFLEGPPFDAGVTLEETPLAEMIGTVIGRYKLLEKIGEGGMAVVYMAEQEKPVRRKVALKIIKLGMDTKQVIARFEAERQALALMEHPNIAKVFDAGATDTGRPYFVMELVRGVSITEYCDQNRLSTQERLDLFIQVCHAVQHAHQKGIIHRDIKPTNVMVTLHDDKAVPKVIDFGIAKATSQQLTEKTLFTRYAQIIGTPEYMSPEQAQFSGLDIDTRTDIYSLGVLLYELLTGTTPFDARRLRESAYVEIQRIIREEEPPKPSTRLSTMGEAITTVAEHRRANPNLLAKLVRGDLDWIAMKSLEKDRTRRYSTAVELAADIGRHLNSEPVAAGAPTVVYKMHKFIRRHHVGVTAGLLVVAALVAGLITSTVLYFQAEEARQNTQEQREIAEKALVMEDAARIEAVAARNRAQEAQKDAEGQYRQSQHLLARAQHERGMELLSKGDPLGLLDLLEAWDTAEDSPRLRRSIGRLWAIAYNLWADRLLYILPQASDIALSPDGKFLARSLQNKALLWDMETWRQYGTRLELPQPIGAVKFSPDGKLLAAHSVEGVSQLWYTNTFEPVGSLLRHKVGRQRGTAVDWKSRKTSRLVDFSPDGRLLATGYLDGSICLWDTTTGQSSGVVIRHEQVRAVAFSPDSRLIATGSRDRSTQLWEVATGRPYGPPLISDDFSEFIRFSPNGKLLATKENADFTINLWEVDTGRLYKKLRYKKWLDEMEFSPDGKLLAASSWDWTAPIWEVSTGRLLRKTPPHNGGVKMIALSTDGRFIATASNDDKAVRLSDMTTGEPHGPQLPSPQSGRRLIFSPGDQLLVGPGNRIWRTYQQLRTETVAYQTGANLGAISPDEKTGAIVKGNTVQLWDTATKQALGRPLEHEDRVTEVTFNPDGTLIACGYGGYSRITRSYGTGFIKLWDVNTGRPFGPVLKRPGYAPSLVFSPNGKLLADGGSRRTVRIFDVATGQSVRTFNCATTVLAIAYGPDGRILATGSENGTVELWDIATGDRIASSREQGGEVYALAFSPDGNLLATVSGSGDQTVRIWDFGTDPPYQSLVLPPLAMRGREVLRSFNKDGTILFERNGDGAVKVWRLPASSTDLHEMQLRTWLALGARRSPQGELTGIGYKEWHELRRELARKIAASEPQLVNVRDSGKSPSLRLVWTPGSDALAHKVYFGLDPDKLRLLGQVEDACFEDVPTLNRNAEYWFRVDTVKLDGRVIKGSLWRCWAGRMVGWWKFDEKNVNEIADSSGNGLNGEPVSDATIVTDAERGNVLTLDGDGDYVDCGSKSILDITREITVATWIKPNDCGNDQQNPYVAKGDYAYTLQHGRDNAIQFSIHDGAWSGAWYAAKYTVDESFNRAWHHLAGTYDGNYVCLYVDGVFKARREHSGFIDIEAMEVNLGRSPDYVERLYDGALDDVRIYSYALTQAEIAAIYAGEEPLPPKEPRWFIGVYMEEYEQPNSQMNGMDSYRVLLDSEQDPAEKERLRLESLDIVRSVLGGPDEPNASQVLQKGY